MHGSQVERRVAGRVACATAVVWLLFAAPRAGAQPPAQRLPSAVLVFPYVTVERSEVTRDTRVELLNLTGRNQQLSCFYVEGRACGQFGFAVRLTPNQPLSWLASQGTYSPTSGTAVPPFRGTGELKCRVIPAETQVDAHNAVQGRAIVFGSAGETVSYGAVGFRRLADGELSGIAELDGRNYERCPGEQHFVFVASESGSQSEIILTPCSQDLANQAPSTTTVQFLVVNEFEESLSASTSVTCYARRRLADISPAFRRSTLGSETGHVTVRGVQSPVLALVIDRFSTGSTTAVAGNEPALNDGRAGTIRFP